MAILRNRWSYWPSRWELVQFHPERFPWSDFAVNNGSEGRFEKALVMFAASGVISPARHSKCSG
jgi:hypothetical protein